MPTSVPALSLDAVSVTYGHVEAVSQVTFSVDRERTVALIGPNGAGKSTLLRAISNQATKVSGRVLLHGRDISTTPAHRITRRGVGHVPEDRQVIEPLSVEENLLLAAHASHRRPARAIPAAIDLVLDLFAPLRRLRGTPSGLLSGGEQQMVAIGRALVARPEVLLLDEPSMGLAPVMVEKIYRCLAEDRSALGGAAVVLAEQNRIALDVADTAVVLSRGRVVYSGPIAGLADDVVQHAYLGSAATLH